MTILEACCDQLWMEPNVTSGKTFILSFLTRYFSLSCLGVALMFAQSQAVGVRRFEGFASSTHTDNTSKTSTLFFSTDDLLTPDGQATLPPLEMAEKLLRLLEI